MKVLIGEGAGAVDVGWVGGSLVKVGAAVVEEEADLGDEGEIIDGGSADGIIIDVAGEIARCI